ncbi:MAG: TadE/TadG family type IV pilus assembly protein [Cyanobacteria bacterium P01_H01_bin.74]
MLAIKRYKALQGQNLVELVFTLPFFLILVLYIIEFGHFWMTYEGAKTVIKSGVHAATLYHSDTIGENYARAQANRLSLNIQTLNVQQVNNTHTYQGSIELTYIPYFSSATIPTLNGGISLLPGNINLFYRNITDVAVY